MGCYRSLLFLIVFSSSIAAQAKDPVIFIDNVHGEGDLALKAMELDKLVCVAGTNIGEQKKKPALCAHEVTAMMQHFAMSQNLGVKTAATLKGPDYYFQRSKIVFRAFVEMGKKKDGSPRPVIRIQRLEGGHPPKLIKEQTIPLSSIPQNHEISFIQDLMLSLLRHKKIK